MQDTRKNVANVHVPMVGRRRITRVIVVRASLCIGLLSEQVMDTKTLEHNGIIAG